MTAVERVRTVGLRAPGPLALSLLLCLLAPEALEAQGWLEARTARQTSGEEHFSVDVTYGAGELRIHPAEPGLLYEATMRYHARHFRPVRSFRREDGRARLTLGLETDGPGFGFRRTEEGDIDLDLEWGGEELELEDLGLSGRETGRLELALSRSVPTELELETGAVRSRFELGDVALRSMRLRTGASETRISFDEPNPVEMEELRIEMGAASLSAEGLGNARARRFRFKGAVGDLELDFTGDWTRDARATVKMGLGSVSLRIPSDLGVRVEKSSLLSSFSAAGFRKTDGGYQTENWDSAEHRLRLEVDAAFGSIDVEVVP